MAHLLRDVNVSGRELDAEPGGACLSQAVGGLVVETVAGALTGELRIVFVPGKLPSRPLGGIQKES